MSINIANKLTYIIMCVCVKLQRADSFRCEAIMKTVRWDRPSQITIAMIEGTTLSKAAGFTRKSTQF